MLDRNDRGAYDPCHAEILEASSSSPPSLAGHRRLRRALGSNRAALLAISLLLLAAIVVIAVLAQKYVLSQESSRTGERQERCTNEACLRVAWRMLTGMNSSADPCQNFYTYACGGWQNKHSIPHNNRHSWSTFDDLQYDVDNFLRARLETQASHGDSVGLTNAKTFYEMCMNLEKREAQSFDSIRAKVQELGGAPLAGFWNPRNLTDLVGDLLLLNVPALVKIQSRANEQNSSKFILSISPPDSKMPSTNQTAAPVWLSQYISLLFNTTISSADLDAVVGGLRNIHMLAALYNTGSDWGAEDEWNSQLLTIEDLYAGNQTHIDWLSLIRRLVGSDVDSEYEIHVKALDYLHQLNDILGTMNQSLIADVMVTQLLLAYMDHMPTSVRLLQVLMMRDTQGDKFFEPPPKWHECLDAVKFNYPLVLANVYLNHYFTHRDEIRKDVSEMIANIKHAFEHGISELDWMDNETKSKAVNKLKVMRDYVAFDELTMNETYVDARSSSVVLQGDRSYLSTLFNLTTEKVLADLGRTKSHMEDMHETMATPFVVNAFYDMRNSFYIMAAILQGAFYGYNNPSYINYAAMGYVIGHEITHGFDDDGRKYDSDGNLMTWWPTEVEEVFTRKKQCFIEQYGGMRAAADGFSYQVDGNLTLSENMADNGGLKSAYRAYEHWHERHGAERPLPDAVGLGSWQQAFFVASAQLWCAKYSASGLAEVIERDNHSPAETRVNAVVMNFDMFSDAFHCPLASPMNPSSRCAVW